MIALATVAAWSIGHVVLMAIEGYHQGQIASSVLSLSRAIALDLRRERDLSDARRLYTFLIRTRDNDPRVSGATIVDLSGTIAGDLQEERVFEAVTDARILAVLGGEEGDTAADPSDPDVLVATVPIAYPEDAQRMGAYQVRYDIAPVNALYRNVRWGMFLAFAGGAALLAFALEWRASLGLERVNRDLAQQVQDRTKQLLHAERLTAIGTLASGVAHEINNPIATIRACAEGLERTLARERASLPADLARKLDAYLPMIRSESDRCRRITAQLLDFSRKQSPTAAVVDLRAAVSEAVSLTGPRAQAEDKPVDVRLPQESIPVKADGDGLKQILVNLIINALDASASRSPITVTLDGDERDAVVRIADRGRGLTESELRDAFVPFFTTKPAGSGTGLGLAICEAIVHQHGGAIRIDSEGPGRGAVVTVRLPRTTQGATV